MAGCLTKDKKYQRLHILLNEIHYKILVRAISTSYNINARCKNLFLCAVIICFFLRTGFLYIFALKITADKSIMPRLCAKFTIQRSTDSANIEPCMDTVYSQSHERRENRIQLDLWIRYGTARHTMLVFHSQLSSLKHKKATG